MTAEDLERSSEDSGILDGSFHYVLLPLGAPQLPSGTRLSRKSTPSRLIAKDEKTGAYYSLENGKWRLAD